MEVRQALLLLLVLPGSLIAVPIDNQWLDDDYNTYFANGNECASTCTESTNFGYQVGKMYRYSYEATGVSNIPGASDQSSSVSVSTIAYIHVISKCEMALTLSDTTFKTSNQDPVKELDFNDRVEENPLYFAFQDGRIEELCSGGSDSTDVLNFKRGVLSSFQNSMTQHHTDQELREIDVSGNCPTEFTVQKGWKSTQISKTKDLLGCSDRQQYRTSLQSTPFHMPDAIQSLPLLKGDLKCSQTVTKEGILTLTTCTEALVFRPFSRKESGAKTETTQKLEFLDSRSRPSLMTSDRSSKTSLLFDHSFSGESGEENFWAVQDKLEQMCTMSAHGISREVPGLFSDMVYQMKKLNSKALNDLWSGVNNGLLSSDNKEMARQFMLDGLPMTGTEGSVKLMVDLLLTGEVTGILSSLWLKSFTFLQHPNKNMIQDSFPRLLTSENLRLDSLLPVTSAINNYCQSQENCQSQTAVSNIVDILEDILGQDCQSSDENLMLTTLRAVGNLGFSDKIVPTLESCMKLSQNRMAVRVSAVQAYRGITCHAQRKGLMEMFINKGEDSELRINAYLGLMMCPTEMILEKVKETLENEEINQVGSFVWTHLTNLAETSSPHKQDLKTILQDERLKKEFDMDKRKFSRNYEMSFFSDRFGLGGMAESNLIWSSSSFLPRSAMVNLTVDVLGHSVNLFEAGGRVQGLQQLLFDYIGNKMKKTDNSNSQNPSACGKPGKMNRMNEKHSVEGEDLSASLYLRMFGNELEFKHFTGKDIMALKDKWNLKDLMASLVEGKDVSFTHSAMFMDSTIIVPTIAGMALQLSVNGTASIQLKAKGKMDLRRLSLKRMEMNLDVAPSGAVQFGGEMSLNAWIVKSGMKMTTTLHSRTAFSGSLDLTNGQVLKMTADTPGDKLELLDIQSEFFIIQGQAVKQLPMLEAKAAVQQRGCSDPHWIRVLGYQLCGQVSYVNATLIKDAPYFPLTGPLSGSIVLHKRDLPEGFKILMEVMKNKASFHSRISIDTPRSEASRAFGVNIFMEPKARSFEFDVISPWKKILTKGAFTYDSENLKVSGAITVDKDSYELSLMLDKELDKKQVIWSPSLQIVRPKNARLLSFLPESLSLSGTVKLDKLLDELAVDIDIQTSLKPSSIKLQANYILKKTQKTLSGAVILNKKEGYSATFQVIETYSGKNDYPSKIKPTILISAPKWRLFLLSGSIDFKKNKLLKSNLQVTMDRTLKDKITLAFKVIQSKSKYRGNGKVTSQFGTIKSKGFVDIPVQSRDKKGPLLVSKITTSYKLPVISNKRLRRNLVILSTKIHNRSSKTLMKYTANVDLDSRFYQEASFVANADFSHKDTFTKSLITLKKGPKAKNLRDKSKQLKIETSLNHKLSRTDADIKYDLQILYPIESIEWQINGKHEHHLKKKLSIETYNSFVFAKGKSSEIRLKVDGNNANSLDYVGLFEFMYPTFQLGKKNIDGGSYRLVSTIKEGPSKLYTHSLQATINKKTAHSILTTLKILKKSSYDLNSKITIDGKEKTTITFWNKHEDQKTESSMEFKRGKKKIAADASLVVSEDLLSGTWDVSGPFKRTKGSMEAHQIKGKEYKMKFVTHLDADRDMTKKIDADYHLTFKSDTEFPKYDLSASLNTPYEGYETFVIEESMEVTPRDQKYAYKVVWARKENEFSYKIWNLTPVSVERFQMDYEIVTPFENLRIFRTEIRHKFDGSAYWETSVKSKHNKNDVSIDAVVYNKWYELQKRQENRLKVKFMAAHRDTLGFTIGEFPADLSYEPLAPHFPKSFEIQLTHKNDEMTFDDEILHIMDNKESKINHHTTYTRAGKMINLKSNIFMFVRDIQTHPVSLEVSFANTLTNMNTTILATGKRDERMKVDIGATFLEHDQTLYVHYSGTLTKIYDFLYKQHHSSLGGWSGSSFYQINRDLRTQQGSKYKITKTELNYESYSSSQRYVLNAEYNKFPYTVFTKYSMLMDGVWKDVVLDGSLIKNKENDWSSDVRLVTPFEPVRNIDVKGNLKDIGQKKWSLTGDISYDVRKKIKLEALAHTEKWNKLHAEIQSPWKDVTVDITNKKQRKSLRTDVSIKYDTTKEIKTELIARYKDPKKTFASLELSTPFDVLRKVNAKTNLNKIFVFDNDFSNFFFDLKTTNEKLNSFRVAHTLEENNFDCDFEMISSSFEKVKAAVYLGYGDKLEANVTIIAPVINRAVFGYKTHANSWVDFQSKFFGEFVGKEWDMDIGLKLSDLETKSWLTFDIPEADKSFIKASVHRNGNSLMDFDIGGVLQLGKGNKPYNMSAQFSYVEGKTALGTTFETPFHDSLSYLLKNEKSLSKQTTVIYARYEDNLFDFKDKHEWSDSMYKNIRQARFLYEGKGHSSGYSLEGKWSPEGEEVSLTTKMDDTEIEMEGTHTPAEASENDEDTVDVFLTTPFENFKNLEFHSNFKKVDEIINGEVSVEYMDDKEAEMTYVYKKLANKLIASAELTLPIKGYEKNSMTLTIKGPKEFQSFDATAVTGQGEKLRAVLQVKEEGEYIFDLVGPIREFKKLKIAGKYNANNKRLTGDVQLRLTLHERPLTFEYDLDMNEDPVIMTFRLRSPYQNFRRADLTIKQRGRLWDQFTTTSILTSEKLGTMTLETDVNYKTETEFEGTATLSSSVKDFENLRLFVKTYTDNERVQKSKLEVGWDIAQEIVMQTSWTTDPSQIDSTLDITTPFDKMKSFNAKFSNHRSNKINTRSLFARHNDHTYLDVDMKYQDVSDLHLPINREWIVDMRHPRPMFINLTGEVLDFGFNGKMLLNWDKRSPESKFEFTTYLHDKSKGSRIDTEFSFKVIHPVRVMAVQYLLRRADNEMQSSSLITWDENKGNTFSYDIGYTDRSTMYSEMYDAHVKIGVPQRSVKVQGSYGNTSSSRKMTGTVLWDADKDESKKVILTTTHEYSQRNERLSLNLNLPSINKQLNVGVALKRGYGSVILDSKTEISYSSDPRKNIHITNKIVNTVLDKENRGDYNYTMETGFQHAVTDIDVQGLAHISRVADTVSIGNQLTYLTLNKEQKVFGWRVETDIDKTGTVVVTTPLKMVSIVGKRSAGPGIPVCSLELFEDSRKTLAFSGSLRPRARQFEATLHYDRDVPERKLFVNGGYLNDRSAELMISDKDNVYAKMNVKLNGSHVVFNKITWKPTLPQEFNTFMGTKVTAFSYTMNDYWKEAVKNVGREVKAKYMRVSQELRDEMGQLFSLIQKEMEIFSVQLETLRTKIRRIYSRNDLHIRDMGQQVDEALVELLGLMQNIVKNYRSYYNTVSQATNDWIKNLKNYPISLMYGKTIAEIMETMEEIRMELEKALQEVVLKLQQLTDVTFQEYVKLTRSIDRKLNSYLESKQKLAVFKQMMAEKERLSRMGADYKPKHLEMADEFFLRTQEVLEDQFHDLMARSEFQQMHAMGTEIYQQFKYWNPERGIAQGLTRLADLGKNLLLMEITKMKNMLLDVKKTRVTHYDPQTGVLMFEIHVPFGLKSLAEPPEFKMGDYLKDAQQWIENRLPNGNSSLWDHYYGSVPSLNPSKWVPPYEASGYVIGSQHIISFDKAHMDYLTACSHVLVRDMLNDSFSVILNYNKNPRRKGIKSLCFNIGKSMSLEITKDYRLTVNKQETEMPFMNDLVSIFREGNTIRIEYINGLEVISDPSLDLYKVEMSGWYHGRTAGLLGNYDNEKENDVAMVDQLLEYEVNHKYCSKRNVAITPDSSLDVNGICTKLFQDTNSRYRPCFKQVDPESFLKMCQVYLSTMSETEAAHKATEQYRFVCRDAGVFMGPSEEYIPCKKEDAFFVYPSQSLYQSADVVFVMEDAKCNIWASKSLTSMATEMDKVLSNKGMKNNRFALAGYRGSDVTVRTMHGAYFGKANYFLKAVETLKLTKSENEGDLVKAVRTAMKYPFRPGVAKVLVIAPCTPCQVGLLERNLDSVLKSKGFMVHILQEQGFSLTDNNSNLQSYRVYGIDNTKTITNHASGIVPLSGISMRYNDYCNVMASTTNGSVFDTTHLSQTRNRIKRDFIKSFANKVGWSTQLPSCQRCKCSTDLESIECQLCDNNSNLFYLPMKSLTFNRFIGGLHDFHYDLRTSLERLM